MSLQKKVFERYYAAVSNLTYKQISNETGIQITRVFRILNGSKMRLDEFQAVEQAIARHTQSSDTFEFMELARSCTEILSEDALNDLKNLLYRKVALASNLSLRP